MDLNRQNWINRPYPFVSRFRDQLLISFSFGLFIFFFLLFFQPFGLGDMNANKALYVLGFGVITFFVMLANYTIIPRIIPGFFDADEWIVRRDVLFGLWNIVLIALANYLYNAWIRGTSIDPGSILSFIVVTASVGIFPLTIMVFINELYLNKSHQNVASIMSRQIEAMPIPTELTMPQKMITLGSTPGDSLDLHENDLVYIQAQDNYCLVHYYEQNKLNTQLLRITLKTIENQLNDYPHMIRCHRSFLVNRQKIAKITGNARAYTIIMDGLEEKIPVSRGINKDIFIT